jgi:GT2 family glycosyltransferase
MAGAGKQNELIQSLKNQLAAKERELENQKWVFEQFMKSPSWRMTYPIRWLAAQLRALRNWIMGRQETAAEAHAPAGVPEIEIVEPDPPLDLKGFFTNLHRVQLESFLASGSALALPPVKNPDISVILVLFNRAELTFACLRSLSEDTAVSLETIIVDNASQDETLQLLDRLQNARIIRNPENRNFLLAANQAAREAKGKYLLILNNDAQVLPGTLRSALKTIQGAPDIGAVGGRVILLDGTLQEAGSIMWRDGSCLGYGRGDNPVAPMYMFRRDVDYCSGAFLLTPRHVWEKLNGFDEQFKPLYYEETDYCARLWERGLRVVYDPYSVLVHYEFGSSTSTTSATDLQREHQQIFVSRHAALLESHYAPGVNSILPARMKPRGERRILFIDDRVPHAWLGSGFPRARAILLALLKENCFVTFYPFSVFEEAWTSVYSDMPAEVEFMMGYGPALLEAFLRIRFSYYDTIFISRPHNMKILKSVIDAHKDWFQAIDIIYDAEAIFVTREVTFRELSGAPLSASESDALFQEEVELASAADRVIAVSASDGDTFRRHGMKAVQIVGHCVDCDPTPRTFSDRSGFLFVGAIHEEASPNGDSVIWFLEEILPKIRTALGDVPVILAGVNKSERIKQLATQGVTIAGHVADLTGFYDAARVFIAPTRYAAGIPHKVHEAAARGLPIVATPLLASQLGWADQDPFLVAGTAEAFASNCIQLYTDSALWTKLRTSGLNRAQAECSPESFERSVGSAFKIASGAALPSTRVERTLTGIRR